MKKIKQLALSMSLFLTMLIPAAGLTFSPVYAADIQGNLCRGADLDTSGAGGTCNDPGSDTKVQDIINTVINFVSLIVGVISVLMIIFGGFRYITSGGDSTKVNSAKNTILYALIGLVIVALAQVIVKFVLNKATSP